MKINFQPNNAYIFYYIMYTVYFQLFVVLMFLGLRRILMLLISIKIQLVPVTTRNSKLPIFL